MKKKQTMNTKKRSPIIDLHFCLQRGYWQVGNSRPQGNKQRVIERKWASCAQVQTQYSLYCNNEEETCSPVACSLQPSWQVVLKSKHSTLCNNEKEACSAARSLNEGALYSLCFWITLFVRKPAVLHCSLQPARGSLFSLCFCITLFVRKLLLLKESRNWKLAFILQILALKILISCFSFTTITQMECVIACELETFRPQFPLPKHCLPLHLPSSSGSISSKQFTGTKCML